MRNGYFFKVLTRFATVELVFAVSVGKKKSFKRFYTFSNAAENFLETSTTFNTQNCQTDKWSSNLCCFWVQNPKNQIFARTFLVKPKFWQTANNSTSFQKECRNIPRFFLAPCSTKSPFKILLMLPKTARKNSIFQRLNTKKSFSELSWHNFWVFFFLFLK